jgi:hypothetical protein
LEGPYEYAIVVHRDKNKNNTNTASVSPQANYKIYTTICQYSPLGFCLTANFEEKNGIYWCLSFGIAV